MSFLTGGAFGGCCPYFVDVYSYWPNPVMLSLYLLILRKSYQLKQYWHNKQKSTLLILGTKFTRLCTVYTFMNIACCSLYCHIGYFIFFFKKLICPRYIFCLQETPLLYSSNIIYIENSLYFTMHTVYFTVTLLMH